MENEYIIVNKTALLKMRKGLDKDGAHSDGIYISDYQRGQIDLIDAIISSQSTPLLPEIDKAYWAGMQFVGEDKGSPTEYISNLKLDV